MKSLSSYPVPGGFMPHFHIPLQSGSDEVLKLMRQPLRYRLVCLEDKEDKGSDARCLYRGGRDCGYPWRDGGVLWAGLSSLFKSLDVTQLHVFSYSERPGTQALKIDHVVAPEEKHRRSQQSAGAFGRKDPCFLCAPYRADDAGVAGTSQTRTADARLHSQLYPCGSPS